MLLRNQSQVSLSVIQSDGRWRSVSEPELQALSPRAELTVAVCQMTSSEDVEQNSRNIALELEKVSSQGPIDLVCLPENCLYMRVSEGASVPHIDLGSSSIQRLVEVAVKHSCVLHLGSLPLKKGESLFNSSLFITPSGEIASVYDKIHLFDVDVKGIKPIRESDVFTHGDHGAMVVLKGWKLGVSICYDLRFSELYSSYCSLGADVLLVPSAFTVPTGKAHWEVLLKARAIESQAFVVAAAQAGQHHGKNGALRETYGHSLVVDPWGALLLEAQESGPVTKVVKLKSERIKVVRQQIPMSLHRRL